MGLLKTIGATIEKVEIEYDRIKEESKPITRASMRVFDAIIPPPKKKTKKCKCDTG